MRTLEVDPSREYLYTTGALDLQLYRTSPTGLPTSDTQNLTYLDRVPIVRSYPDTLAIQPDNLLLYNGGHQMLLSDSNSYDAIYKLDLERGIITNHQTIHQSFGPGRRGQSEDHVFKVNRFDYNTQGPSAQHDLCAIGINSNHIMRFDLNTGQPVHYKAYESACFTCLTTDQQGNVIVGDAKGTIRFFTDVGKRATASLQVSQHPIIEVQTHPQGVDQILVTTDYSLVLVTGLLGRGDWKSYTGRVDPQLRSYLGLDLDASIRAGQFSSDGSKAIFALGRFLIHWNLAKLMIGAQEFSIWEAGTEILGHKWNGQWALTQDLPVQMMSPSLK